MDLSGAEICQTLVRPIHAEQRTLAMPGKAVAALKSYGRFTGWLPEAAGIDV